MRFLITGANGQVGSEWVEFLKQQGENYKAFTSSDLDITNKSQVIKILDDLTPDIIINCAAFTKVDEAEDERDKAFSVNADAVGELAGICKEKSIKLVHYSTDYVFPGSIQDAEKFPDGYAENHPVHPVNLYGESKLKGEQEIQYSGCDYLLIRTSWVCGKHGHNFVKTMLRLAKERKELNVVNDQWGSPAFAHNVVENTFQLIMNDEKGIFHLSSEGKTNWYEFACEIFNRAEVDIKVKPVSSSEFATKAVRPAFSLLSLKKIANIPGVKLIHWRKGLQSLLDQL